MRSHLQGLQILPPTPHPHTSYSVCVREQREGQDLPRLLVGVMHKTDPVVFMQRKTERERGETERERERERRRK